MKIKEQFVLRQVADTYVVLPLGDAVNDFHGMLSLNEPGVVLWRALEKGADRDALADALMSEYIVEREQALADADEFIQRLRTVGCIEE